MYSRHTCTIITRIHKNKKEDAEQVVHAARVAPQNITIYPTTGGKVSCDLTMCGPFTTIPLVVRAVVMTFGGWSPEINHLSAFPLATDRYHVCVTTRVRNKKKTRRSRVSCESTHTQRTQRRRQTARINESTNRHTGRLSDTEEPFA